MARNVKLAVALVSMGLLWLAATYPMYSTLQNNIGSLFMGESNGSCALPFNTCPPEVVAGVWGDFAVQLTFMALVTGLVGGGLTFLKKPRIAKSPSVHRR